MVSDSDHVWDILAVEKTIYNSLFSSAQNNFNYHDVDVEKGHLKWSYTADDRSRKNCFFNYEMRYFYKWKEMTLIFC